MTPPFALPPPEFPLPAYVRQAESGLIVPKQAVLPGLIMPPGLIGAAKPRTLDVVDELFDETDRSSYTFTNVNLGKPAVNRHIMLAISGFYNNSSNFNLSSVTIGGQSANFIVSRNVVSTNVRICALAMAKVPSGTTGTVAVAWSHTSLRCEVGVWRVEAPLSSTVPVKTRDDIGKDPMVLSLDDIKSGDVVAAAVFVGDSTSETWTGLPQHFDIQWLIAGAAIAEADSDPFTIIVDLSTNRFTGGVSGAWR